MVQVRSNGPDGPRGRRVGGRRSCGVGRAGEVVVAALSAWAVFGASLASGASAPVPILQAPAELAPAVKALVSVADRRILLDNVKVVDGTGGPAMERKAILLEAGKIAAVLDAGARPPGVYRVLDLTGRTVIPGLIGMHDHLFYIARPNTDASGRSDGPILLPQMSFSAPRLYLANGVTTIRTAGSVEPYADLNLKREIDAGNLVGPHMDVTGPYLEGRPSPTIAFHQLTDERDARETVAYWADRGATSFKAYMNITRAELRAAIQEAHRRGLKVTGHLCSITYPEAIGLGIDNLEHGFWMNTQDDDGRSEDQCPASGGKQTLLSFEAGSPAAVALIKDLVDHHVALTSTLPVFEQLLPNHAPLSVKAMDALTPEAREAYLYNRNHTAEMPEARAAQIRLAYHHEVELEREFVAAGGLLQSGADSTGNGGVVPGFGDLRGVELLVEAGFSPESAIRIATLNGARYLGLEARIGSIAAGKDADLVVVNGDPVKSISDIEAVELVFKDGVAYDPKSLLASVRGRFGEY